MPRHRHSERVRSDKRLREPYKKRIALQLVRAFWDTIMSNKRYLTAMHKRIQKRIREAYKERAEELVKDLKKRKFTVYAIFTNTEELKSRIEQNLINRYGARLDELIYTLTEYSRNAFSGIPPTESEPDMVKAVGRYLYCPFNQDEIHTTACAIRLTPLTAERLRGLEADFYIIVSNNPEDLQAVIIERSNPVYHVMEFLRKILQKKRRGERHTRKRKGHYGIIDKNEPIHLVYTNWFEERFTLPLWHVINCGYCRKLFESFTIGIPQRGFRVRDINVVAIIGRKGVTTKRYGKVIAKWSVYDRSRRVRGKV